MCAFRLQRDVTLLQERGKKVSCLYEGTMLHGAASSPGTQGSVKPVEADMEGLTWGIPTLSKCSFGCRKTSGMPLGL